MYSLIKYYWGDEIQEDWTDVCSTHDKFLHYNQEMYEENIWEIQEGSIKMDPNKITEGVDQIFAPGQRTQ
jgi:hypothetical protein